MLKHAKIIVLTSAVIFGGVALAFPKLKILFDKRTQVSALTVVAVEPQPAQSEVTPEDVVSDDDEKSYESIETSVNISESLVFKYRYGQVVVINDGKQLAELEYTP